MKGALLGQIADNLLVYGIINFFIRSKNVHCGFVIDQLLNDKGQNVKCDNIWILGDISERRCLVFHIELFSIAQFVKTASDLILECIFACGFNQFVFHQLRGNGIGQVLFAIRRASMAFRLAKFLDDSIFDNILDSRVLGRNTLDITIPQI